MKKKWQYLLVDDDATSNLICELNIKKIEPQATITSLNDPQDALLYIEKKFLSENDRVCILFLDINMPSMTGWEFLEAFQELCPEVQKKFMIYILTSSIEDFTEEKKKYPYVAGFLSKPIKSGKLRAIMDEVAVAGRSQKLDV